MLIISNQPNNKEVLHALLPPISSPIRTNTWCYVPRGMGIRVWVQHWLEIKHHDFRNGNIPPATGISGGECDATTTRGHETTIK